MANLSTGRVLICVAKDGIAIAGYEVKSEAESRPPMMVQLSRHRAAILLGAAEWTDPGGGASLRLERELPRVVNAASSGGPRLEQEQANDLEPIGLGLMEVIRTQTGKLHRKLDLREDEPLVELLLVGYVENYGPEIWSLRYHIVQEPLRGEFYRTRILRPRYTQLYPPEKGQPRTLVEVRYPEGDEPSLLARLSQDPSLAGARTGDPQLAQAAELIERGEGDKAKLEQTVAWLRGLLHAVAPPDGVQMFAIIRAVQGGFEWVLEPPEKPAKAEEEKPREPGAPTLKKKP